MPRRTYTPDLANRSQPLVRRIAGDIQATAREIQTTWEGLQRRAAAESRGNLEEDIMVDDRLRDLRDRFQSLTAELAQLGVELKDPLTGLLDFRWKRGDQEVYLCWRLGEDSVAHWHTLDGGFAGRRPLTDPEA
jgi:hypothetical protein